MGVLVKKHPALCLGVMPRFLYVAPLQHCLLGNDSLEGEASQNDSVIDMRHRCRNTTPARSPYTAIIPDLCVNNTTT